MSKRATDPQLFQRRSLLLGGAGSLGSSLLAGSVLGAAGLASFVTPSAFAGSLAVIVHPSNSENLSNADLAAMFTTRKQAWNTGKRVVPFNFPPKHGVREQFDRAVLSMSADEVARYWIDRRIRGGNPPPKQVSSGQLIVRLVAKLDGAIAYVPEELVASDVRVVRKL